MDYIEVDAHVASELIRNHDIVFEQTHKAGLKLSIENCQYTKHSIEFL